MAEIQVHHKFDPISVIEVAYRLDLSERSWLQSLALALRPKIGPSAEIVAGTFILEGSHTCYGTRVGIDIPDHFMAASAANLENGLMLERLFGRTKGFFKLGEKEPMLLQYLRRDLPRLIESVGLVARRNSREGLFVSTHATCDRRASYREKYLYDRLISHIEAGHRLRKKIPIHRGESIEAVLSPSGTCLYAQGPARNKAIRDPLSLMVKTETKRELVCGTLVPKKRLNCGLR